MKLSAQELAVAIGAAVEGDGAVEISGIAAPERAASGDLVFVAADKHVARAQSSAAKCAVLPPGLNISGKTVLRSANAKVAFAEAAAILRETLRIANGIH